MALGRKHPQTAYALLRLSALYNAREAFTQAEPLAEEALAITERTLGSDHPRVASCLTVMSLVHSRRDNYDRAVPELQRALTIAERAFNPDDSTLLGILNNLGDLYALRKDFDRAEPLLTRSLEGIERTFGRDHIRVAVPLQNLGTIAREKKVRGFAVVLRRTATVATGRIDHRKALKPVVDARMVREQVVCDLFGLVQSSLIDQVDDAVRRVVEAVSLKVLTASGAWVTPVLLAFLDDRSRLCWRAQWYLAETAETVVHGLCQALGAIGQADRLEGEGRNKGRPRGVYCFRMEELAFRTVHRCATARGLLAPVVVCATVACHQSRGNEGLLGRRRTRQPLRAVAPAISTSPETRQILSSSYWDSSMSTTAGASWKTAIESNTPTATNQIWWRLIA
jgi:tetratricopeptide (TPR) repeat protein